MPVDRHINFFELQKALEKIEKEGTHDCPLCLIIRERTLSYIDDMLFEHVGSDRVFRKKYRDAGGFCPNHAKNLENFRDCLAVAILSRDILEDRVAAMKEGRLYEPKGRCPICEQEENIEREYLTFLLECDGSEEQDRELIDCFTRSPGLCLPHYQQLLSYAGKGRGALKKIPSWLREFHEKHFTELQQRINTFIDLSAYGNEEKFKQLSKADQLVWKEAAVSLRGEKYL
jgi:hypothetical protein